jgi:hypothetical protein
MASRFLASGAFASSAVNCGGNRVAITGGWIKIEVGANRRKMGDLSYNGGQGVTAMPRSIAALLILCPVGTFSCVVLTGCQRTGSDGQVQRTPVAVVTPHKMATPPRSGSEPPAAQHQQQLLGDLSKRGVTQATEQRIYREEEALEARAKSEARSTGASGSSEAQREHAIEEKYRRQLLLRYRSSGLTAEELQAIISHGEEEHWPAPGHSG